MFGVSCNTKFTSWQMLKSLGEFKYKLYNIMKFELNGWMWKNIFLYLQIPHKSIIMYNTTWNWFKTLFAFFIQKHSQIYESSLAIVFKCPNSSEYMYKTLEKCANVCGNSIQDGSCAYHCMRDSSKTKLVECCAKPKILFGKI